MNTLSKALSWFRRTPTPSSVTVTATEYAETIREAIHQQAEAKKAARQAHNEKAYTEVTAAIKAMKSATKASRPESKADKIARLRAMAAEAQTNQWCDTIPGA